nr:nuclear pore complex protein Nup50-like isoform X2 [Pocillopora verrucosa]
MAKRGADKELTQDNWDQEEDEEEVGHFKVATSEDLSKRKIIKAKRRVNTADNQGKGVFQGFSGFGSLNNNATDFGTSTPATKPLTGFFSLASSSKNMFSGLNKPTTEASSSNQNGCKSNSSEESKTTKAQGSSYEDNLKALNESIVAWIQKHLNTNPFVDLSPIFDDYKQHMKNIDSKFSNSTTAAANSSLTKSVTFSASSQPAESSFSPFSGPPPPQASQETQGNKSNTLNTEAPSSEMSAAESQPGTSGEENAEEEVPKPKSVVVAEEGAFHSIRCKLFFKRESSWVELGIGMLNLKKLEGKTQLLVRNDTALGKIVLNVYLAENTPISRSGKNNVMLISVPNPPLFSKDAEGDNSKPATYLIRVKTSEDADELFKKMETNKT